MTGPGPLGGGMNSLLAAIQPVVPFGPKIGAEARSAPIADQTKTDAEAKPVAARATHFPEMARIRRSLTRIPAVGIAQSYCWESPKPREFGTAGQNWENIGWKVTVKFTELENRVRPKEHITILRPLLPEKYSPLQPNGNGLQSVYLSEFHAALAEALMGLIGREVEPLAVAARDVKPVPADDLDVWEHVLEQQIARDSTISGNRASSDYPCTERPGLIQGSGEQNRIAMQDHRRPESGPSGRQSLQALARFIQ